MRRQHPSLAYRVESHTPVGMSRYASNQQVVNFFASHGIEVTHVRREGALRHLRVKGQALTLPMPASADECLRLVRECIGKMEK